MRPLCWSEPCWTLRGGDLAPPWEVPDSIWVRIVGGAAPSVAHSLEVGEPHSQATVNETSELRVVIGTAGYRSARKDALKRVGGYTLANNVTARDIAFGAVSSPGFSSMTSLLEDEIVASLTDRTA